MIVTITRNLVSVFMRKALAKTEDPNTAGRLMTATLMEMGAAGLIPKPPDKDRAETR